MGTPSFFFLRSRHTSTYSIPYDNSTGSNPIAAPYLYMKIEAGNLWPLSTEARAQGGCAPSGRRRQKCYRANLTEPRISTGSPYQNGLPFRQPGRLIVGEMARFAQQILRRQEYTGNETGGETSLDKKTPKFTRRSKRLRELASATKQPSDCLEA